MTSRLMALPWLLPAPADFKARARAVLSADSLDRREVRKLGAYASDLSGLETMGKVVRKHRDALIRNAALTPFRLGIVSSHTMNYVAAALPGTALRHNLVLEVLLTGLEEDPQQLFGSESELARAGLDAILIALDYRVLGLGEAQLAPQEAEIAVHGAIDCITELASRVRRIGSTCVLQTLVPPADPLFGSLDGRIPGSVRAMVERFNEKLIHEVAREDDLVLDAAFLASIVGLSAWNHARDWNQARLPGALDSTPLYADHICRLLAAARGRNRKCLVMDLDDTLWGGTIGDDGLEGIRLGHGSSVGEAHVALQRYLLDLNRRGVILAVCSQNAEANAILPFRAHPEMVLRTDHISAFIANWSDKASNIREIVATLNIGTDEVVFLDDNPAERAKVRDILPEVAVPELTSDPADYAGLLSTAGYFEAARFSREDFDRGAVVHRPHIRQADLHRIEPEPDLESLRMVATISHFNSASCSRIAQMFNTTDQFNLTDRHYSEQDVEKLESAPDKFCLRISLADRCGDNGLVSVVIFDRAPEEWRCDTWLMSARALGRRVEELALASVAQAAAGAGASQLVGVYTPTPGNAPVADIFAKLRFTRTAELPGGGTEWVLDLATYRAPSLPFEVVLPS